MVCRSKLMLATRLFRGGGYVIAVLLVALLAAASASASATRATHRGASHRATRSQAAKNQRHAKKHSHPKRTKHSAADSGHQPKVLARGDYYATLSDQPLTVSAAKGVLANDTDLAKQPLQVDRVNKTGPPTPIHATTIDGAAVTMHADGSFTYDATGVTSLDMLPLGDLAYDWFTYRVSDNNGGNGGGSNATASVLIVLVGTFVPVQIDNVESSTLSYDAGTPAVPVSSNLTIAAPSDKNLVGATVKIGSGFLASQDHLTFVNQNGITGSYNSGTGVLTLSGTATLADYQAALRSVTYSDPNGASPTTGDRKISFQADDGRPSSNLSNVATRTIDVEPNPVPTAGAVSSSTDKHTAIDVSVLGSAGTGDSDGDTVSVTSIDTTGTKGSVSINADGSIHYDPNGQFESLNEGQTATDTFTYKVSDGFHTSSAATVTVTINGSNDAPAISNVEMSGLTYDAGTSPLAVSSTLTLSDPDDSSLSGATVSIGGMDATPSEDLLAFTNQNGITGSFDQSAGVLTLSGSASVADYQAALRSITFSDPNGTSPMVGPRSISFQVDDGHTSNSLSNTEARTVTVAPNPIPTAAPVAVTTDYKTAIDIPVLTAAGTGDSDGDAVRLVLIDNTGTKGALSANLDHTIHYDPNGQFDSLGYGETATDTFTYTVSDGFHNSTPGTVTVTIDGPTTPPPALANVETSKLAYTAGTPAVPVTSSLTISAPDSYPTLTGATVTIGAGFTASEDSLSFTNQNGITGSYDSSTGVLTLSGSASLADYQTALQSVQYSDSNGKSPSTGDRTISFQVDNGRPGGNLSNVESRTVTVVANPVPTTNPVSATTNNLKATDINVLSGAGDIDGDPVSVVSVDNTGTKGTISINSNGTVHYDPNGQFNSLAYGQTATDTFTYTVSDGFHNSTPGTVTVTITGPATAAPVLSGIETSKLGYDAGTSAVPVTSSLTITAPDSYATISGATVSIGSGFTAAEDQLVFTNQNGITGSYDSSTGVLTLTGTTSLANYQTALQSVEFFDANGASPSTGDRAISFQVDDGRASTNLSNSVSRTITVDPNPAPTAGAVTAATNFRTPVDIPVLSAAGTGDTDGDTVAVKTVETTGTVGAVSINKNGTIHYDPTGLFNSMTPGTSTTDTFSYTVSDGFQNSAPATVTVTVTRPVAPVLANLESTALSYRAQDPGVAITSAITISDKGSSNISGATISITSGFDSGADLLSFTPQSGITASYDSTTGVMTLTGTASLTDYQAALRTVVFSTSDASASPAKRTISFVVTDDNGSASDPDARDINVSEANQAPTAVAHSYTAVGNTPLAVGTSPSGPVAKVSGSLLNGDSDPDSGGAVTVSGNTNPAHGTVTVNADGTFTYLPTAGYSGTDSFQYTIVDGDDAGNPKTASATVTITVGTVVWYVDNSQTAAGDGRADSPFNTLAAANSAAGANSILFLYQGSGNYLGGASLQSGEDLFGQPYGLTVAGYSLVTAGGTKPTITNASGDGIVLGNGSDVEAVNVSSPSGNGISGTSVNTATIGTTDPVAISSAGGDGIHISGGSGNLNFGDSSVTGSTGHSVYISGRAGGTTTLAGSISDTGKGIDLSSNTGATIGFTGKLTASTGTYTAFAATAGGTVAVTGSGSTLATTTGTALDVENTTISGGGLTFQSISAGTGSSGPANGIELVKTGSSGGLTVTGTGSGATGGDGSGGTIQHTSSSGSAAYGNSNGGVYLDNTDGVSLTDMNFANNNANGVYGTSVDGLDLSSDTFTGNGTSVTNADAGLRVDGLTGPSSITNTNISGSRTDEAHIYGGGASTSLTLTVGESSFKGPHTPGTNPDAPTCGVGTSGQGDGLLITPEEGAATVTAEYDRFQGNYSDGLAVLGSGDTSEGAITLTAEYNDVVNNCNAGINLADEDTSAAPATFTIEDNTDIVGQQGDGISVNNSGGGIWTGHISGNTIGAGGVLGSGSLAGEGISVDDEAHDATTNAQGDTVGASTLTADVSSNTIDQIKNGSGILGYAADGPATLNLTLTGNDVHTDDPLAQDAITVQSGNGSTDKSVTCLAATGNTSISAGTNQYGYDPVGMSVGEFNPAPKATFEIVGPTPLGPTTTTAIQNYLDSKALSGNTLGGIDGQVDDEAFAQFESGATNTAVASCPKAP
jgi:VCBS repeat-containing protein